MNDLNNIFKNVLSLSFIFFLIARHSISLQKKYKNY